MDHFAIESGSNGFCILKIRENSEEYFLPLVEWPGIYENVRANFYLWAELARRHTKRENLLRNVAEVMQEEGFP